MGRAGDNGLERPIRSMYRATSRRSKAGRSGGKDQTYVVANTSIALQDYCPDIVESDRADSSVTTTYDIPLLVEPDPRHDDATLLRGGAVTDDGLRQDGLRDLAGRPVDQGHAREIKEANQARRTSGSTRSRRDRTRRRGRDGALAAIVSMVVAFFTALASGGWLR